jgi:hypothetical protein
VNANPMGGATRQALRYSVAGVLRSGLERVFMSLGFNRQISVALATGNLIGSFMSPPLRQRVLDARAARVRHRPT